MTNTELRRLAENATPGAWQTIRECVVEDVDFGTLATTNDSDDARYIAAASPDVIIELLDRCEALEKERDEARNLMPWHSDVVAFAELADRAPRCDAAEDLASWCMMILRAHAAKGGE